MTLTDAHRHLADPSLSGRGRGILRTDDVDAIRARGKTIKTTAPIHTIGHMTIHPGQLKLSLSSLQNPLIVGEILHSISATVIFEAAVLAQSAAGVYAPVRAAS
jgi:hypothetical protein